MPNIYFDILSLKLVFPVPRLSFQPLELPKLLPFSLLLQVRFSFVLLLLFVCSFDVEWVLKAR